MLQRIVRRLAREARPIRFLTSRVLWHTGASPWFVVRRTGGIPGGYRVRLFPSSASSCAWVDPDSVNEEVAFVARTLRPGDTCVDVGASVGPLALRAASGVGAAGQVVAIEAHPRTAGFRARPGMLPPFLRPGSMRERGAVADGPSFRTPRPGRPAAALA
jgi:hypothetical protein